MTIADRLNQIIIEQNITKMEFARRVGISCNYLYILTGKSRADSNKNKTISYSLAKLIALEFGYDADWIMTGESK
ncbi:MAG: helix-turn-helix transcriptional regulator [Erysipelotrichales bacterium]|nr:helix-turn-helix transcriptional regulator [Erysipelotrichales bacterium]